MGLRLNWMARRAFLKSPPPNIPQTRPSPQPPGALSHSAFGLSGRPGAALSRETSLFDLLQVYQPSWTEQDLLTVEGRISTQTG